MTYGATALDRQKTPARLLVRSEHGKHPVASGSHGSGPQPYGLGLPDTWPDDIPGGGLRRWVFLPAKPSSVRQTRLLAVTALADWHVDGITEDVCTCISELAANACRHAHDGEGSVMRVSLHLMGRYLSVHVRDKSSRLPVQRYSPGPDETGMPDWASVDSIPESGLGLHLVNELADGWSWWSLPVGKVVACWFQLDTPHGPAAPVGHEHRR